MKYKISVMVVNYDCYIKQLSRIKNEVIKDNCEVVAITNGWISNSKIGIMDGFPYYNISDFFMISFDYLIVAAEDDDFWIIREKVGNRVRVEKILSVNIFEIPDFDFGQYINLLQSRISIISYNCWGGITYANMRLSFNSPTINLRFEDEENFCRFVSDMDHYLSCEVIGDGSEYEEGIGEYPCGIIDDVRIRFVHYGDFDEAVKKWNERKTRINKDNIFLMFYTDKPEMAKQIETIKTYRKVIFTTDNFEIDDQIDLSVLTDICALPPGDIGTYTTLAANGEMHLYNAIKMLNGDEDYIETKPRL